MHDYSTLLNYALFTPRHDPDMGSLVKVPFYASRDRSSNVKSSSFLCYIPMSSTISEDLVFKKGIMLAIDDIIE